LICPLGAGVFTHLGIGVLVHLFATGVLVWIKELGPQPVTISSMTAIRTKMNNFFFNLFLRI
jgi:hypothetical protein